LLLLVEAVAVVALAVAVVLVDSVLMFLEQHQVVELGQKPQ
jgi:hypothetical protein